MAPRFNTNAVKLKTKKARREAFDKFCAHIAAGKAKESFFDPCTFKTLDATASKYPEEFDTEEMVEIFARAVAANFHFWEELGMKGAAGKIYNFNATSWIFNMKNRFGWGDKLEVAMRMVGQENANTKANNTLQVEFLAPPPRLEDHMLEAETEELE